MKRAPESEHDWFRRRLPDHLLDLLVEGERRRFDAHARSCEPCARTLALAEGARPDWWDGAAHPPVSVLLGWQAGPGGDVTREAVRAHLAHCEDCRRDLEELRGPGAASGLALVAAPAPRRDPDRAPAAAPRWRRFAAPVATLAAAVLLVVVWPRGAGRTPVPAPAGSPAPVTGAPPAAAPPAAEPPAPAPRALAEPVAIAAAERGAAAAATAVTVAAGVEHVRLTLPALAAPDGVMMEIALRDSAGVTLVHRVIAAERALRPGGVDLPAEGLATGRYVLAVRWVDPVSGETSRQYPLDVRVSREP